MTWAVKMADARYDDYDEGYEKGISIGLEQGAYQTKLETARSFLAYGDAPEKSCSVYWTFDRNGDGTETRNVD